MEYFDHGTLFDYMKREVVPIPERDVMEIMRQLLRGIHMMHAENYAHRDLKPSVGARIQVPNLYDNLQSRRIYS